MPKQREWLIQRLAWHLQEGKINVISTAPQFGRACIVYGTEDGAFAIGHAGKGTGKQTMVLARYVGGCGAGRCYCAIQPNGDVTPCVYIPSLVVGNLRNQRLGRIWDCEVFSLLSDRADRGGHCGSCNFRAYCGGCRARALAYTGDIKEGDPGCFYNRAESEESPQHRAWPKQAWGERPASRPRWLAGPPSGPRECFAGGGRGGGREHDVGVGKEESGSRYRGLRPALGPFGRRAGTGGAISLCSSGGLVWLTPRRKQPKQGVRSRMKPIKAEGSPRPEAPVGRIVSVLLVDEDANDIRSYSSLFEQEGYAVRACDTHADALRSVGIGGL